MLVHIYIYTIINTLKVKKNIETLLCHYKKKQKCTILQCLND